MRPLRSPLHKSLSTSPKRRFVHTTQGRVVTYLSPPPSSSPNPCHNLYRDSGHLPQAQVTYHPSTSSLNLTRSTVACEPFSKANVHTAYNDSITLSCNHFTDIADYISDRKIAGTQLSAKLYSQPPYIALLSTFE